MISNLIRDIIGGPALCLQRGACVHYAPHNARSFLINRACRLVYRLDQKSPLLCLLQLGDPEAGEYGGVYQASNWTYLGQGPKGRSGYRTTRQAVLLPGLGLKNPGQLDDQPACCASTAGISPCRGPSHGLPHRAASKQRPAGRSVVDRRGSRRVVRAAVLVPASGTKAQVRGLRAPAAPIHRSGWK